MKTRTLECVQCGWTGEIQVRRGPPRLRCLECAPPTYEYVPAGRRARGHTWTEDAVRDAILRWYDEFGRPPSSDEWNRGQFMQRRDWQESLARWERGCWPSNTHAMNVLGVERWTQVMEVMGFPANVNSHRPVVPTERVCPRCGESYGRREGEKLDSFYRRKACSASCSALLSPQAQAAQERKRVMIELRSQGLTNREIAARMGVKATVVGEVLARARKAGLDVPRAPYWDRKLTSSAA